MHIPQRMSVARSNFMWLEHEITEGVEKTSFTTFGGGGVINDHVRNQLI